jgi:uncharacterized protein (DUF433 family)
VYHWAKIGLYGPSVWPEKIRLYSLSDVVHLRAISWLRSPKEGDEFLIPRSKMPEVRKAIAEILSGQSDLDVHSLNVDQTGKVFLSRRDGIETIEGQGTTALVKDMLRAFSTEGKIIGPDLVAPRPHLRIVRGKLGGEPHVRGTRLRTVDLADLREAGYLESQIAALYPFLAREQILEALDLEAQLQTNLRAA